MMKDRVAFVRTIKRQEQYGLPPDSVQFLKRDSFNKLHHADLSAAGISAADIVLYKVGMTRIRSDPYTGMAILYHYLYISENSDHALVLWFPHIDKATWIAAARNSARKDIRLFKHASEGVLFKDGLVAKNKL
jgi:hypothetical protein